MRASSPPPAPVSPRGSPVPALTLATLPFALLHDIAARLPDDDRLVLLLVCRSCAEALSEPSLWRDVKLTAAAGVTRPCDALLLSAASKARGSLRSLDCSGRLGPAPRPPVSVGAVARVAHANGASLRELRLLCHDGFGEDDECLPLSLVAPVLAAAPGLARADADVSCAAEDVDALLPYCSPHGPLRVRRLGLHFPRGAGPAAVAHLLADLALLPAFAQLALTAAPLSPPAALAAVVDAALHRRLATLSLVRCKLGAASMPALSLLLAPGSGLASLDVFNAGAPLPPSPAFCAALRAAGRLERLELQAVGLWGDVEAALSLLRSLSRHPSLRHLDVSYNPLPRAELRAEVGAALARLLLAPAEAGGAGEAGEAGAEGPAAAAAAPPAAPLTSLDVSGCCLGCDGLRPLADALPACGGGGGGGGGCARLERLCVDRNAVTRPFAAELLARVRGCASLRALRADGAPCLPDLAAAEALVAARCGGGGGGGG